MGSLVFDIHLLKSIVNSGCRFVGDEGVICRTINSTQEATENEITWIKPKLVNSKEIINSTNASCIICDEDTFLNFEGDESGKLFIISNDPKFEFFSLLRYIRKRESSNPPSLIHESAIIDSRCKVGKNVTIGAFSIIGNCVIGDNTTIGEYVKINDKVNIGSDCVIREHVSIGGEGFGFYISENGKVNHIPHIGDVKIGNHVHIFPFANVDRGTLSSTIIEDGSVIDHYVHISHNSKVGKNTIICANSVLAGGSEVKDNCFLGVNTLLKEKVTIGNSSMTGMGTIVVKHIPDNEIWVGNPAKFLRENIQ